MTNMHLPQPVVPGIDQARHILQRLFGDFDGSIRIWRFYMAACAVQFEEGNTGVYQILASRRAPFSSPVPLTRRGLYDGDAGHSYVPR